MVLRPKVSPTWAALPLLKRNPCARQFVGGEPREPPPPNCVPRRAGRLGFAAIMLGPPLQRQGRSPLGAGHFAAMLAREVGPGGLPEPDSPDAYGGLGIGGSGLGRPCSAEPQGRTSLARAIGLSVGPRRYSPVLPVGPTTKGRPSMFSQAERGRIQGMEVLLGVELCMLTGFVIYGWGPEGYRTLQRRKRRRRSRGSGVRPSAGVRHDRAAGPAHAVRVPTNARWSSRNRHRPSCST